MRPTTCAGIAVGSVRDLLSRYDHIPKALSRLRSAALSEETLDYNPPQPPRLLRDPLTPPLATTRFRYPDGSAAIFQQEQPHPDRPQRPARARAWVDSTPGRRTRENTQRDKLK